MQKAPYTNSKSPIPSRFVWALSLRFKIFPHGLQRNFFEQFSGFLTVGAPLLWACPIHALVFMIWCSAACRAVTARVAFIMEEVRFEYEFSIFDKDFCQQILILKKMFLGPFSAKHQEIPWYWSCIVTNFLKNFVFNLKLVRWSWKLTRVATSG